MTGRQMQRNEGNPDAQAEVPDSQIEWGQETSWFNYKTGKWESTTVTITTNLEAEAQRALEVGVNEHNLAIAAHERASDALRKAVEAGSRSCCWPTRRESPTTRFCSGWRCEPRLIRFDAPERRPLGREARLVAQRRHRRRRFGSAIPNISR